MTGGDENSGGESHAKAFVVGANLSEYQYLFFPSIFLGLNV